ncbi:MAG TPA: hypothetical protein DCP19_00480 [Pseudomonas sp.]|nr:hypothetical protein [Pseudomonas sp.]
MSKRKQNNPQARLARNCRAFLSRNQVAAVNIDRDAQPDLIDQRLISLLDGLPIARDQLQPVATAFCDFSYSWTVYISVLCRDQQGTQYIKSEEIALANICRAEQLTEVLEHFCCKLRDGCNTKHIVGTAWIADPCGVSLSEEQAAHIYDVIGAWAHVERTQAA